MVESQMMIRGMPSQFAWLLLNPGEGTWPPVLGMRFLVPLCPYLWIQVTNCPLHILRHMSEKKKLVWWKELASRLCSSLSANTVLLWESLILHVHIFSSVKWEYYLLNQSTSYIAMWYYPKYIKSYWFYFLGCVYRRACRKKVSYARFLALI